MVITITATTETRVSSSPLQTSDQLRAKSSGIPVVRQWLGCGSTIVAKSHGRTTHAPKYNFVVFFHTAKFAQNDSTNLVQHIKYAV